jgi:hypothetical protein
MGNSLMGWDVIPQGRPTRGKKRLRHAGCYLKREGGSHTLWTNPGPTLLCDIFVDAHFNPLGLRRWLVKAWSSCLAFPHLFFGLARPEVTAGDSSSHRRWLAFICENIYSSSVS